MGTGSHNLDPGQRTATDGGEPTPVRSVSTGAGGTRRTEQDATNRARPLDPSAATDHTTDRSSGSSTPTTIRLPSLSLTNTTPHVPRLPDPRPYIEIRPTRDALHPGTVGEAMRRLATTLERHTETGLWRRLRGRQYRPAVEWLLVGDGREDTSIRWLVGVSQGTTRDPPSESASEADEHTAAPVSETTATRAPARESNALPSAAELLDSVERVLRTMLPRTYELTRVQWHPRFVEEHLPVPTVDVSPTTPDAGSDGNRSAITVEDPYVAGVEYRGHSTLARDWQLPLRAFCPRPSRRVQRGVGGSRATPSAQSATDVPGWHADERRRATGSARTRSDGAGGTTTDASPSAQETSADQSRLIPLADMVEVLRDASLPVIYQVVCRPYGPWRESAEDYRFDLQHCDVTLLDAFWTFAEGLFDPDEAGDLPRSYQERLAGIEARATEGFVVAARTAVLTRDDPSRADRIAHDLADSLTPLAEPVGHHRVEGHVVTDDLLHAGRVPPGRQLFTELVERHVPAPSYGDRPWTRPWRRQPSPSIVATAAELPGFCLLDGARLTPHGERSLSTRPAERTGLVLPPPSQLARYTGPGMQLCMPLTHDRRPYGRALVLPEAFQDHHVVVAGATGTGKSVAMNRMLLSNVASAGGLHLLLDYKGSDSSHEYLQSHYRMFGDLDDVHYIDLTENLPAFTLFDIRPLLEAGINREEARSRVAAHYIEMLVALMTPETFYAAVHAEEIITNHIRALFDPVHGRDVFSHDELTTTIARTKDGSPPAVSDDHLERYFATLLDDDQRTIEKKLGGALSRVERIDVDSRLYPLFTSGPATPNAARRETRADSEPTAESASQLAPESAPRFSFHEFLAQDVTIVFDFGGMDRKMKSALTLAILSALWTALTVRAEADRVTDTDGTGAADRALVNLFMEEAGDVAHTSLVGTLLREGRGFGLSMALGVQFPGQLRTSRDADNTYEEVLNEVATFLVGNVALDDDLAKAFATDSMPPAGVANRLRALARGEWLVRPGTAFGEDPPRPFLGQSLAPPPGHPASDDPLAGSERIHFDAAFLRTEHETARRYTYHSANAVTMPDEPTAAGDATHGTNGRDPSATGPPRDTAPDTPGSGSEPASASDAPAEEPTPEPTGRLDSLLPYTQRLPAAVSYDESAHALFCAGCGTRYDLQTEGMLDGIECCHSLADVDRDDIPPCQSYLKLSPAEVAESDRSVRELLYVQAVFNAQQGVFDPIEYDITRDSMLRLQEYVGIDSESVQSLIDGGVLRKDTNYPYLLHSVAPSARSLIGEAYREGIDYGDGRGDLEESSEHVMLTELAARWAQHTYVDDTDAPGDEVKKYHDLEDGRRLDCVVLDAEGSVRVAIEAERINNDTREAVPADYDKLAVCEPDEAVWVVTGRGDAHTVLQALNDPLDGDPRVAKTYSETSPPQRWHIDTPGATAFYTYAQLRRVLDEAD